MFWCDTISKAGLAVVIGGLAINSNNNNGDGSWRGNLGSISPPTMVTWLVDGNNLSCSRKVPNDRETILRELSKIASPRSGNSETNKNNNDDDLAQQPGMLPPIIVLSNIVVVFDGNEDEKSDRTVVDEDKWLEWTVTDGRNRSKDRADDWIVDAAIPRLREVIDQRSSQGRGTTKVNLVSADKGLQKRVRATNILKGGGGGSFVHPPKFWNDFLPVLQEQHRKQQQQQQEEA